ncbi:hypothetical protein I4U23_003650 [Adineta vaga]|nr:hypothetical protein I4U23_003650 [Adineta vaga]
MEQLSWPNTVQLTLSIQYFSELKLLFQHNALPAIEYMNIILLKIWILIHLPM